MSENPQVFQCPHCHASITQGQTYCSNCKTHIAWHSGQLEGVHIDVEVKYPN